MVSLAELIGNSIIKRRLFRRPERILIAVSGGVDSMVLLDVLHQLSHQSGWKLTIAYLNHQLRGTSSLADERLVRRTATRLKLPIAVSRADVRGFAQTSGLSLEMAARKLRHDFLARVARQRNIASIALAHHLDDQVELFFLRLLRGTGSQGLSGMKWSNPSPSNPAITLVRPFLDTPKSALLEYAAVQKIPFRDDATNNSLNIQRNRIRNELLPLLARGYQAGLVKNTLRVMDILGAESDFLNAIAESWLAQRVQTATNPKSGSTDDKKLSDPNTALLRSGFASTPFEALPTAVQRRCLQLELIRQGVLPEYDLIEHLRLRPELPIELCRDSLAPMLSELGNGKFNEAAPALSIVRLVRKPQGIVRLSPAITGPFLPETCQLELQGARGKLQWDGVNFAWRILRVNRPAPPHPGQGAEFFDADSVGSSVVLRHWRPGDRFQPIGMPNAVKLQDLFVNQKVLRERRRSLVVAATTRGDLFWVEGLRISERFKLTKSTIRRLHWAWQRL